MSIDAMKQALEALQAYGSHASNCDYLVLLTSLPPQRKPCSCGLANAITALRAAIEQAQDPVAWMNPSWIDPDTRGWASDSFESIQIEGWIPLYTAPRQWKGLTDEEIAEIAATPAAIPGSYVHSFARAIEAKLREKNT